jgi:hypothetical protein
MNTVLMLLQAKSYIGSLNGIKRNIVCFEKIKGDLCQEKAYFID